MADRENDPSSANVPAPEAPATEAPAIDAPATDALAADAQSTEATAPTAPKPLSKAQKKREKETKKRDRRRAKRAKPIDTPKDAIVSVKLNHKTAGGLVGRVGIDNREKTRGDNKGMVEIIDSNGDSKYFRPGSLLHARDHKDAFEDEGKKPRGEPYSLGGDDDASGSGGDEALDKPPVAKEAKVPDLFKTNVYDLLRYVEGSKGATERDQRARRIAALLVDLSTEKAAERSTEIERLQELLNKAWSKYEKHKNDHPELYPEEEAEEAPENYSGVPIVNVKLADWVKEKFKSQIQKCVAKEADISWIEAMPSNKIRSTDFTKALDDARGESQVQQQSLRLAGEEAPPLPTTSQAGQSVVYTDSVDPNLIRESMLNDARFLRKHRTLVPAIGEGGAALRGGFMRGIASGTAFRVVGTPGATFKQRFHYYAIDDDMGVVEAISSRLLIDLEACYESLEWDELEPRLVYESNLALESLPDGTSVKEQAKAVYEAYHRTVEAHEHETVWRSTFKAIDMMRARRVDGVICVSSMASCRWCRVDSIASMALRRWRGPQFTHTGTGSSSRSTTTPTP